MSHYLKVHFSSASDRWSTPTDLYDALNHEFHFNFDPCPLDEKADGTARLLNSWQGKRVFCNAPYGPRINKFLDCARDAEVAVFLLPARTDTNGFMNKFWAKRRKYAFFGDG